MANPVTRIRRTVRLEVIAVIPAQVTCLHRFPVIEIDDQTID